MDTIKSLMTLQGQWADKTEEWATQAATRVGEGTADFWEVGGSQVVTGAAGGAGKVDEDAKAIAARIKAEQEAIEAIALADAEAKRKDAEAKRNLRQAQIDHDLAMQEFRTNNAALIKGDDDAAKEAELTALSTQLAKKLALEKAAKDKERALRNADARARLNTLAQTFLMMSTMSGKYNKLFFRMYQATAIANATIAGVEAAVHAWNAGMKYGMPVAVAYTAASIAFTSAQIAAIASQSMPTAPAAVGVAGVGSGAASTVPGANLGLAEEDEERGRVNIYIEGDILADEYYLERLAEKISEAVEGNEVRLIASEVRAT
jgi:hypothetical protein